MAASHYSELVVNYTQPKNRIYQNTRTSRPTDYLGNNTVWVAKSLFRLRFTMVKENDIQCRRLVVSHCNPHKSSFKSILWWSTLASPMFFSLEVTRVDPCQALIGKKFLERSVTAVLCWFSRKVQKQLKRNLRLISREKKNDNKFYDGFLFFRYVNNSPVVSDVQ